MSKHPSAEVPEALFPDADTDARWRARFTAARVSLPRWARDAPDRSLYLSNASGVWEIYAWDRSTGQHRKVTDRPNGTSHATIDPDGRRIWWFADSDGDEFGSWVTEPFGGRSADESPTPAMPGGKAGYPAGIEVGNRVAAAGVADDDGTTIFLADGGETRVIYRDPHDGGVAALSRDETLLAIAHSEHGDNRHPALRVLSVPGGAPVADKWDGAGKGLDAVGFSPVPGDQRLLVLHERRGREELLLWDVATDTETEIELDLPGELTADWYPDGASVLVMHTHEARNTLHRYDIETGRLSQLDTAQGTIGDAAIRPNGTVEYSWSNAAEPGVVRALDHDGTERVLLEPPGHRAPPSVELTDAFVPLPGIGQVHALIARPAGAPDRPMPTVFVLHGGPHSADEDRFSAYRAVWLEAGFVVVHVNYRGSTGYGSAWRDSIEGRPGLTELTDVAAVHGWLVDKGITDPDRCVVNGASWGGYLSLLALGTQPQLWAAGIASVPVADYLAAYADEMEPLRAFDRALFGGSPDEVPDRYTECSPITYVDQVRAPVLVLAGENDPRCPIRQINNYLDRLAERGSPYQMYRYEAGHGSLVVAETIRQTAIEVHFARRALNLT